MDMETSTGQTLAAHESYRDFGGCRHRGMTLIKQSSGLGRACATCGDRCTAGLMAHAMAQPLLLGLLSTISGSTMTELIGVMVLRKETTSAHCFSNSSQAFPVALFSREVLALRNSSIALLSLAWRGSLGSSHSSRAMCPYQGSTSHQIQVNGHLLQNKFLYFTAPRLQNATYTENSSTMTSAVRSR